MLYQALPLQWNLPKCAVTSISSTSLPYHRNLTINCSVNIGINACVNDLDFIAYQMIRTHPPLWVSSRGICYKSIGDPLFRRHGMCFRFRSSWNCQVETRDAEGAWRWWCLWESRDLQVPQTWGILAPGSKRPELGSRVGKEKKSQQR